MKCAKTFNLVHVKFISRAQGLRNHQQTKKSKMCTDFMKYS